MVREFLCVPVSVLVVAALGCGDGRPERVAVTGQVLIDGKPLATGFVRVVPEGARPAYGEIGPDGRFTLTIFGERDGVVLGTHPVAVNAGQQLSETQTRWHAPKKYADPRTSGLTVTITGPTDALEPIKLSWEGGKPFVERTGGGNRR